MEAFIKKHLTCAVCQEEYVDPRRLTCQHVFCVRCLDGHIKANAGHKSIRRGTLILVGFNCPECRQIIRIPRPHEPRHQWANQINRDYKTSNIQSDIRDGTVNFANNAKHETDVEKNKHICSETMRDETTGQSSEASTTSPPRSESVSTEHNKGQQTKKITPLKAEFIRVISPSKVSPSDLVLLHQPKKVVIVMIDTLKHTLAVLRLPENLEHQQDAYADREVDNNIQSIHLGCQPWRICRVSDSQVAVTVSGPDGVLMYTILPGKNPERLFSTGKCFDGIAALTDNRFLLTSEDDVHIYSNADKDNPNYVLEKEFKVSTPHVRFPDISYITRLPNNNIVLTDCGGKAVHCANLEGKSIWSKSLNALGVTSDVNGGVYVVDNDLPNVQLFSSKGRSVCKLIGEDDQAKLKKPSGIAVDDKGFMYVICNHSKSITVWKLEPAKD